eukprot:scaffold118611_cov50-Prasinocladus_malaysianus.AAC.2
MAIQSKVAEIHNGPYVLAEAVLFDVGVRSGRLLLLVRLTACQVLAPVALDDHRKSVELRLGHVVHEDEHAKLALVELDSPVCHVRGEELALAGRRRPLVGQVPRGRQGLFTRECRENTVLLEQLKSD